MSDIPAGAARVPDTVQVTWRLPASLVERLDQQAVEAAATNTAEYAIQVLRWALPMVAQLEAKGFVYRETHAPELDARIAARLAQHTRLGERIDAQADYLRGVEEARARLGAELSQVVDRVAELERRLDDHTRLHPADTNEAIEALDHQLARVVDRLDHLEARGPLPLSDRERLAQLEHDLMELNEARRAHRTELDENRVRLAQLSDKVGHLGHQIATSPAAQADEDRDDQIVHLRNRVECVEHAVGMGTAMVTDSDAIPLTQLIADASGEVEELENRVLQIELSLSGWRDAINRLTAPRPLPFVGLRGDPKLR